MSEKLSIAVVGGTGAQGKGLAYRFARHGHNVIIGSRSKEKARITAEAISQRLDHVVTAGEVLADTNADAVQGVQIVVLAVPYEGHDELISQLPLGDKLIISCVNPLSFDRSGVTGLVIEEGLSSAAETAQNMFPTATVIGAFHNVSAVDLWTETSVLEDDVLVVGDSEEAKSRVMDLVEVVTGRKGIDGGQLRLARIVEPFTAVLISINKKYKTRSGIKITGIKSDSFV